MVDKGKAAGALYVWQEGKEGIGGFDNPHYSFNDVEETIERRLEEDTREFLKTHYISKVDTHGDEEHYQLTDKGEEAAYKVYQHVEERHNGEVDTLMDWTDEDTVDDLLDQ